MKHLLEGEVIATYKEMERIGEELHLDHNDIYCGYLKQPITNYRMIGKQYIIKGTCILNNLECRRTVSPSCYHDNTKCDIYKEYFKKE